MCCPIFCSQKMGRTFVCRYVHGCQPGTHTSTPNVPTWGSQLLVERITVQSSFSPAGARTTRRGPRTPLETVRAREIGFAVAVPHDCEIGFAAPHAKRGATAGHSCRTYLAHYAVHDEQLHRGDGGGVWAQHRGVDSVGLRDRRSCYRGVRALSHASARQPEQQPLSCDTAVNIHVHQPSPSTRPWQRVALTLYGESCSAISPAAICTISCWCSWFCGCHHGARARSRGARPARPQGGG